MKSIVNLLPESIRNACKQVGIVKVLLGILLVDSIITGFVVWMNVREFKNEKTPIVIEDCVVEKLTKEEDSTYTHLFTLTVKNYNNCPVELTTLTLFSDFDYQYVECESIYNKNNYTRKDFVNYPVVLPGGSCQVQVKVSEAYFSSIGSVALSFNGAETAEDEEVYRLTVEK